MSGFVLGWVIVGILVLLFAFGLWGTLQKQGIGLSKAYKRARARSYADWLSMAYPGVGVREAARQRTAALFARGLYGPTERDRAEILDASFVIAGWHLDDRIGT